MVEGTRRKGTRTSEGSLGRWLTEATSGLQRWARRQHARDARSRWAESAPGQEHSHGRPNIGIQVGITYFIRLLFDGINCKERGKFIGPLYQLIVDAAHGSSTNGSMMNGQ